MNTDRPQFGQYFQGILSCSPAGAAYVFVSDFNSQSELDALLARAAAKRRPSTSLGLVGWLHPQIEAALDNGFTRYEIWAVIRSTGCRIPYSRFAKYCKRFRQANSSPAPRVLRAQISEDEIASRRQAVLERIRADADDDAKRRSAKKSAAENFTFDPEKGLTYPPRRSNDPKGGNSK